MDVLGRCQFKMISTLSNLLLFFQNWIFRHQFFMAHLVLHGVKLSVRGAPLPAAAWNILGGGGVINGTVGM